MTEPELDIDELSESTGRELQAFAADYLAELAPEPAQVEAALAKLRVQIGAGASGPSSGVTGHPLALIGGAALCVAVGLAWLLTLGGEGVESPPAPRPSPAALANSDEAELEQAPQPEPTANIESAEVLELELDEFEFELDEFELDELELDELELETNPRAGARPRGASKSGSPAASPIDAGADLEEELRLLARARKALRAGQSKQALAILDEHELRFPKGTLARERDASRVTALCAMDRETEALAAAKRYAAAHGKPAHFDANAPCD